MFDRRIRLLVFVIWLTSLIAFLMGGLTVHLLYL